MNLLLKCNELPFWASSLYSKLKVSSPQKPAGCAESQTKSESDSHSEFVLLEKPSKPKRALPSNSRGGEQSGKESDQGTDSGGGVCVIKKETRNEKPKHPTKTYRDRKEIVNLDPFLLMIDKGHHSTLIDNC